MNPERHAEVSRVFEQVTELPRAERASFLDQACAGAEDLKEEVASLLRHHETRTRSASPEPDERPEVIPIRPEDRKPKRGPRKPRWSLPRSRSGLRLSLSAIALAALLGAIGGFVYWRVNDIQRRALADRLTTVIGADVAAVRLWIEKVSRMAEIWARNPDLVETAEALVLLDTSRQRTSTKLRDSEANARFLRILQPVTDNQGVRGVHLFAKDGHAIAGSVVEGHPDDLYASPQGVALIRRAIAGETVFQHPYREHENVETFQYGQRVPLVAVWVAILDAEGKSVAAFLTRWRIDHRFAELFSLARLGLTGETYAFDDRAIVVSDLRNEATLRRLGIVSADAPSGTALNVSLRDPGGDLTTGHRTASSRASLPLTRMAAHATAGEDGMNLEGYRDFAGRRVVGAWRWLPEYGFGVAAELGHDEAYATSRSVRNIFVALFGALAAVAGISFVKQGINAGLAKKLEQARRIGPYELQSVVAEGGMGTVYRATHHLLKRATAIKVIRKDKVGARAVRRFEQEVRCMSGLSHPNTVQIYDFGIQPDGSLYYAMEYLNGITLAELVGREGPLPWKRTVRLLRQVCLSLKEAHTSGLLHRDVKPQNIMVCRLGGEVDFVKVLDFGLVKDLNTSDSQTSLEGELISGTPLYMAPERLRTPLKADARSDIYAVGCLAFFLLKGRDAFQGVNVLDTCFRVMTEAPPRVREDPHDSTPEFLGNLVAQCMAADPEARPRSFADLLAALRGI